MGLSRCFRILLELNIENSSRCVEGWAGKKGAGKKESFPNKKSIWKV